MTTVTQVLLLLSYAVFGIAAAVFLPMLGMASATAQMLGMLIFIGSWQIQLSFFGRGKNDVDAIDMHRVEEIEKLALKLRKDVAGLRESIEEQSEKGDEKDKKLVTELKMLQEFLIQVMQKESKGKKIGRPAKSEAPVESFQDDEQMTAAEIEELGLAPEEAALVVAGDAESTGGNDMSGHLDSDDLSDDDERVTHVDSGDMDPGDVDNSSSVTAQQIVATTKADAQAAAGPNVTDTPQAKRPAATSTAPTASPKAVDSVHPVKTHAQRRAAAAKKRAPIRLIKREDQLLSVIKNSLSENRVDLYLQPMVSLPARKTAHFECFSRVRDEEGRVVLPRQYMKVAETKGLIGTIDNLLLFRLIQLVRRLGRRRPDIRFFLNMSRYSIADKDFLPQFIDFMVSNSEFAERMVFEISQDDYLTLEEEAVDRLHTLGRKGFAFSMDLVTDFDQDFAELEKRNFKYIKSDIADILAANPEPGEIEEQKAYLRRRGMQLIASKIESEEMVIEALDNQIELAQGYLFGEPLSAEEIDTDL